MDRMWEKTEESKIKITLIYPFYSILDFILFF